MCISLSANDYIARTSAVAATKEALIYSSFSSTSFSSTSVWVSSSTQDMASIPDMDTNGITRHPRRIAGGDGDSFGEGEDGEKLPEVTNQEQKTPIGDIPMGFMVLLCVLYISPDRKQRLHKKRLPNYCCRAVSFFCQSLFCTFVLVCRLEIICVHFEI